MKTWMLTLSLVLIVILLGQQRANAMDISSSTEEVPYDALIQELNSKVNRQSKERVQSVSTDPFDQLNIHVSLGFIQSIDTLLIGERSLSRVEDGVQIGLGIDLFSTEWMAEALLKNFGQSTQNESKVGLREFDLRLNYLQHAPEHKMKVRLSNGVGARYLRYQNLWSQYSHYQTTPIYLLGMGLLIPMGKNFDLDFEVQGHLALISETIDRHGLSLILRLDNAF